MQHWKYSQFISKIRKMNQDLADYHQNNSGYDISEVFNQLTSWSKKREESQRQLGLLLSTFDVTINKKVDEMVGEAVKLKDQLLAVKKERDDLLVFVDKLCEENEKLKAEHPDRTSESEKDDIFQDSDNKQSESLPMKVYDRTNIDPETIHIGSGSFDSENGVKAELTEGTQELEMDDIIQDSEDKQSEMLSTGVHEGNKVDPESIHVGSVPFVGENGVKEHFCPNCHLFFSSADNLESHLQTVHFKSENMDVEVGIGDNGDEEEEKENAKPGNRRSHPCDFPGCSKVYTRSRLEIFSESINSVCTKISSRIFCPA